jgi:hypothetical protein
MATSGLAYDMKLVISFSFAIAVFASAPIAMAAEQCRFLEGRGEREVCYQRQEVARAARKKTQEAQQTAPPKPHEPIASDDAQMAKALRGICRGC